MSSRIVSDSSMQHDRFDLRQISVSSSPDVAKDNAHPSIPIPNVTEHASFQTQDDPDLITWDGDDDPLNPKNWTITAKYRLTLFTAAFSLITLMSSTMLAPALAHIPKDLKIKSVEETQLALSIFVLSYAFGPLLLSPLSEVYGRKLVVTIANLWYLLWNTVCGFAQNKGTIIAARFMSGLGASATVGLGGGILSDCWSAEERGRSVKIYSIIPLLGPALGPILGGIIAQRTTWRWIFYAISILDFTLQLAAYFFFQESYGPEILQKKAAAARHRTGNSRLHTIYDSPDRSTLRTLRRSLPRPFLILATHPIIQILTLVSAYSYGVLYILITSLPRLWTSQYHQSTFISSLHYLSLALGEVLGAQVAGRLLDRIYAYLRRKRPTGPELRVPMMLPYAFVVPVGLILFGWCAQNMVSWVLLDLGLLIFAIGAQMAGEGTQAYVIDTYGQHSASATAAFAVLRSIGGFSFPLLGPQLYRKLGYGWGNSLLGSIFVATGLLSPTILWIYGPRLRRLGTGMAHF